MIIDEILDRIRSGAVRDFNSESNPISLTVDFTRGPEPLGGLTHIKTTLKDKVMDPTIHPNVVFVIDKSGSMQGANQLAATRVFNTVYDALDANTQVSIILFDNETTTLPIPLGRGGTGMSVRKSDINSDELRRAIDNIHPNGGTNIIGALKATATAISQHAENKPTRAQIDDSSIIFITDGNDNGFKKYADLSGGAPAMTAQGSAVAGAPHLLVPSVPGIPLAHIPFFQPTKPTPEEMLRVLKSEMEKDYGMNHFARIMPIGIGVNYDDRLLMGIGEEAHFHRTGFLHIANDMEVESKKSELITTVDPVRMKTTLFVVYKDDTHALYPDVYVQRGAGVSKEYFIDSANIKDIYLIQEHDETHHEITRILSEIPPLERLPYKEAILKGYLIAESAGLINRCTKCQDKTLFPELLGLITKLLQHYPVDFWGKDERCKTALQTLKEHYANMSDAVADRPAPQIFAATGQGTFFNQRDSMLTTTSMVTRISSTSMGPSTALPLP